MPAPSFPQGQTCECVTRCGWDHKEKSCPLSPEQIRYVQRINSSRILRQCRVRRRVSLDVAAENIKQKGFSALVVRGLTRRKSCAPPDPCLRHLLPRVLFFHLYGFCYFVFSGTDLKAQRFAENGISLQGLSQADAVVKITIPACLEF